MNANDDILARDNAHRQTQRVRFEKNKRALFAALTPAGVTHVIVNFDGCGDSGQIEEITFKNGDVETPEPSREVMLEISDFGCPTRTLTATPRRAIEALAYDVLGLDHGGWKSTKAPLEPSPSTSPRTRSPSISTNASRPPTIRNIPTEERGHGTPVPPRPLIGQEMGRRTRRLPSLA